MTMPLVARVLSNGNTQSLAAHLHEVAHSTKQLIERKSLDFELVSEEELERIAYIIGATHDFGKGTLYFQQYIRPDYDDPSGPKHHASISAYYAFYLLRKAGFDREIAAISWYVVQRHHGNLTSLFSNQGELSRKVDDSSHLDQLSQQVESIQQATVDALRDCYGKLEDVEYVDDFLSAMTEGKVRDELLQYFIQPGHDGDIERYYLVLLLFSVLTDADKMNSAGIQFSDWPSVSDESITSLPQTAVEEYKDTALSIDSSLDMKREQASQFVSTALMSMKDKEQLYSLTMPTGSGKTLTAFDAALKLRSEVEFDRPPRIIYSVPFLSIIDQNHGVVEDVLTTAGIETDPSVLLRHDHTSRGYARTSETDRSYYKNPGQALLLTEGWNAEFVTTTFVQFFETLVTNQNGSARRFHKLVNSIIILDEIQAVPTKYWGVIRAGLRILSDTLNSYIILMTATNPLLFEPGEEIIELTDGSDLPKNTTKMPEFDDLDRLDFVFETKPTTVSDLVEDVAEHAVSNPDEDVMVVLNTVSTTREAFQQLSNVLDREVVYLSTRIIPKEREERIEQIKKSNSPKLVVTTQLIEAGVDIDIDSIYRDFAPVDSLVQTAGRCNRENAEDHGTVTVIRLRDDRESAPRDFHYQYVYDSVLTDATQSVLEKYPKRVTESEFVSQATRDYFELVNERKTTDSEDLLPAMRGLRGDEISVNLIEQTYQTVSIFVERDQESRAAYDRMATVYKEASGFERGGKLLGPKAAFYQSVVSVPINDEEGNLATLPTTFIDEIRLIRPEEIGSGENAWYHPEMGFKIPESTVQQRIL